MPSRTVRKHSFGKLSVKGVAPGTGHRDNARPQGKEKGPLVLWARSNMISSLPAIVCLHSDLSPETKLQPSRLLHHGGLLIPETACGLKARAWAK